MFMFSAIYLSDVISHAKPYMVHPESQTHGENNKVLATIEPRCRGIPIMCFSLQVTG